MKKFALALVAILVLAVACGGETPEQVVNKLFSGIQNGDGDAVVGCLSAETLAGLDGLLTMFTANPQDVAESATEVGIEITAEEVADLTVAKAITLILSSEETTEEMPDFSAIEIGVAVIDVNGETATVPVTFEGETTDIPLILEDGSWKIAGDDMGFM